MNADIENALAPLWKMDWFQRVGATEPDSADFVKTWTAAVELCQLVEWNDAIMGRHNEITYHMLKTAPEVNSRWNAIVADIRPAVLPLVREKTAAVIARHSLPDAFFGSVRDDILSYCLDVRFSPYIKPGLFTELGEWYRRGHFPCGWNGDYPDGRLIVF